LRDLYLLCYLCKKADDTLKYAVSSNEVGQSPFLLILIV
jgi:hypothetical protein